MVVVVDGHLEVVGQEGEGRKRWSLVEGTVIRQRKADTSTMFVTRVGNVSQLNADIKECSRGGCVGRCQPGFG